MSLIRQAISGLFEQIKDEAKVWLDIRITRLHTLIRGLQDEIREQQDKPRLLQDWSAADLLFDKAVNTLEQLIPEIRGHEWEYDKEGKTGSGEGQGFLKTAHYKITIGVNPTQSVEKIISRMIHEGTEAYMRCKTNRTIMFDVIPHNYAILMEIKLSYISKYYNTNEIMGRYRVTYAKTFNSVTKNFEVEDKAELLKKFQSISNDYMKRLQTFNDDVRLQYRKKQLNKAGKSK